jgi:hypothetical protein
MRLTDEQRCPVFFRTGLPRLPATQIAWVCKLNSMTFDASLIKIHACGWDRFQFWDPAFFEQFGSNY